MNHINTRILTAVWILASMFVVSSCEQSATPASNVPVSNSIVNSAPPVNAQPQSPPAAVANYPVTMPLLDAMFADESFGVEVKQQLQLSDEDLTKVQDAARNAVLELGADAADDDSRSTRSSVEGTRKKIEEILGREKTDSLFGFVRSRWSAGSQELALNRPNEIPTDTRIVVNAPAYRMDLFKDGQLVKTYKIGIGYPEFPLPTGLRKASEIIFNPTWTPPDEPWVKGKVQPGKKVEAGSKLNPLGPIKIPIGLPSLVHGGKDPSRLGTFASHGCVGLTSPMVQDFAVQLSSLAGAPISLDEVRGYEKNKTETKEVKLTTPVPVELRYETIVVENGSVMIYRDVYERGTNTEENLRKVLESYGVNLDQLPEAERTQLLDALQKMAVDASGKVVEEDANANVKKNSSETVTRNIKGKKEIAVAVASLSGKGYPQPIEMAER